jgi:hypothetical protein
MLRSLTFVQSHNTARNAGRSVQLASFIAGIVALSGCGATKSIEPGSAPPVPTAALNAAYIANSGLLNPVGSDGVPLTFPPNADPMITETLRFYDTLQTPFPSAVPVDYPDPFGSDVSPMRKTAPMTLDDWKRVFGVPTPRPDEDVQAYRDRAGIAIYYNRNELGLGRELGCSRFVDGQDANGADITGIACFVTNYGTGFRQGQVALQATVDRTDTRNTVCITYRPTMDPGYQVQFYVYAADGSRVTWARLDTLGPRPHPQVCTTCHGGQYDETRHLVKNARFLPLDPNLVIFAEGNDRPVGLTRSGQEERVRAFNAMATETPLTATQQTMLSHLYPNGVTTRGSTATGDVVPDAWNTVAADADFYRGVVKPYCATCHLAGQRGLADSDFWPYGMFQSPSVFDAAPLETYVCNTFSMPNAQPTSLEFWDAEGKPGVTIDGQTFPAAADALLARRGLDRSSCAGLASVSGCNRGADPDSLCGGAVNGGATCDLESGRCIPVTHVDP